MLEQQEIGIGKILWEALTLNPDLYEDADRNAVTIRRAQLVVAVVALSHAIGSSIILLLYQAPLLLLVFGFVANALSVIGGYYFWTFSIWKIGKWLCRHDVHISHTPTYRKLLGPIGYAHTPQLLNFLTVIPLLGRPIEVGLATWSLLAVIVAVRQGLGIGLWRAVAICVIGWPLVQVAIGVVQLAIQWLVE